MLRSWYSDLMSGIDRFLGSKYKLMSGSFSVVREQRTWTKPLSGSKLEKRDILSRFAPAHHRGLPERLPAALLIRVAHRSSPRANGGPQRVTRHHGCRKLMAIAWHFPLEPKTEQQDRTEERETSIIISGVAYGVPTTNEINVKHTGSQLDEFVILHTGFCASLLLRTYSAIMMLDE